VTDSRFPLQLLLFSPSLLIFLSPSNPYQELPRCKEARIYGCVYRPSPIPFFPPSSEDIRMFSSCRIFLESSQPRLSFMSIAFQSLLPRHYRADHAYLGSSGLLLYSIPFLLVSNLLFLPSRDLESAPGPLSVNPVIFTSYADCDHAFLFPFFLS